ncbi:MULTISPECIES: cellulose biosynthesis cyclic di-GMP-binding regulatory protein BcsB [unclassified Clostridioides]|uniref:cellulose biosynthesis cyclic di-GMP-binding regulatory protein BcsB n=1 Tax=unclassified Clostridioides TaxID=2635829 RepID=UPI001D0F656B|nr:cellulose biosynthesis cyclic di-GMP-binding regulatory protein BcsB [Clostridioides sp. ES-S-0049-03]MCC0676257.1 cellulose biosynthesis cyclic di-GMP-binding regulatory protein BcsB [Clostridioides sp. ES-W-0018-02]MCC0710664.1 cellulose biosynthesis cyclic di-GMP-binding regulatory protein BcsB [Clostridioides sp. ES-W-0017-02]
MKKFVVLIVSLVLFFSNIAFVDEVKADETKVKNYKFERDVTIDGVIGSNSTFFEVNKNWDVEEVLFNLNFSKSQILNGDVSSLTILINNVPIKSIKLNAKKDYKDTLKVSIPKDYIIQGYNEIKVKAYKTISDKICQDDSNTGNWMVIHKESYTSIRYKQKKLGNSINEYPYPYIEIEENFKLDTTLVVPDNMSRGESTAVFNLASEFGKITQNDKLQFDVKLYSEMKNWSDDNIIYIGKPENTAEEILNILSAKEQTLLSSNCIIKQINSPYNNNKKMLVVIGSNEEDLIKASKVLIDNRLSNQILSSSILVNKDTNIKTDGEQELNLGHMTLEELGYADILLEGAFSQQALFDVRIPKGRKLNNGSKIVLNLRYSDNLDFDKSLVTVYINDVVVGSKKLDRAYSDNDKLELKIPKDIDNKNYYQVKLVFNLNIKNLNCVTRESNNPWAYVSNSSYLELSTKENQSLNFESYPYPFVKNDKFNDLTVIMPDYSGSQAMTWMSRLGVNLGANISSHEGNINVIRGKEFINKYKDANIIVFGAPLNNSVIKMINSNLNVKFNKNYSNFLSNDKISFIDDYGKNISSIQLIKSPYNNQRNIMVISSIDEKNLYLGMDYLLNKSQGNDLKGDTLTIDEYGEVKDLNYNTKINKEIKDSSRELNISKTAKVFFVVSFIVITVAIILSILFIKKYKRR